MLEGSHFLPISLPPRLFSTPEDVGKAEGPELESETSEHPAAVDSLCSFTYWYSEFVSVSNTPWNVDSKSQDPEPHIQG